MRPAFRSKNEVVYDTLRQAIIQGEYEPGTRLVIDELATTLGVSQIPIREAIRQLEADGFVTFEPYVGATIAEINANFIFEVFALLESMEITASRAAARCMSDDEMQTLEDLIFQMDSSVDDPYQWSKENKQLHLFICECAKTTLIQKMMQKVLDHWDRLRLHYLKDVSGQRIKIAQREHNQSASASYIQHLRSTGQISADEDDCP